MVDSTAYLSAVATLIGTFVGGVTSIATSWLGQQRQTKEQRRAREKHELQALYSNSFRTRRNCTLTPLVVAVVRIGPRTARTDHSPNRCYNGTRRAARAHRCVGA
jgi:hypothetical protein